MAGFGFDAGALQTAHHTDNFIRVKGISGGDKIQATMVFEKAL